MFEASWPGDATLHDVAFDASWKKPVGHASQEEATPLSINLPAAHGNVYVLLLDTAKPGKAGMHARIPG